LNLAEGADKKALLEAMRSHVLAFGGLMAHYKKTGNFLEDAQYGKEKF
jgi:hypothetical protein